ncbi:MAG TPA: SPOR domain-containing protein [Burkholderiales bacterium]|jgi:DedD protein|nr:SPOR domain-containing protein [Burkholderiales bacterium]
MNNKANPNNAAAGASTPEQLKQRSNRRLLAALLLIGVAIGGLALMERWRQRPAITPPPHEPSQALIAPPSPESSAEPVQPDHPVEPPPPPQVVNNEKLVASAKPAAPPLAGVKIATKPAAVTGKAYVVQVGVFMSPANAQALQQQLAKAGLPAHTETRVQLGPFQDRREAETALANVKKLGVNAVLVAPR